MRRKLIIYSFLTFVLLPISAMMGIAAFISLPSALSSPAGLLDIFILASFVLYVFTAFSFFTRGVQGGKPFKAPMKDFIKVNGYVAFISSLITVVMALLFYAVPVVKELIVNTVVKMQQPSVTSNLSRTQITNIIGKGLAGGTGYSVLLIVHFIITLQLLKQYGGLFVKKGE